MKNITSTASCSDVRPQESETERTLTLRLAELSLLVAIFGAQRANLPEKAIDELQMLHLRTGNLRRTLEV